MGTQTEIAKKIHQKDADYVLAVKKNQQALHEEVSVYMENPDFQEQMKENGNYLQTTEYAHSQIEIREYYQTDEISWMHEKKRDLVADDLFLLLQ